ncbi:glutamine--tRNA ligase, partial [Francisella tularensis subsp. holarctica]|nr:glutamine--tRNA ligase [Francisella tularensis subsp. holarctica]
QEVITDTSGEVIELNCSYLPETLGGKKPNVGIKPNGIIHWVDANNCLDAEVRIYVRLFNEENPAYSARRVDVLNTDSLR